MIPLHLPHQDPLKFAQYILSKTEEKALVHIEFPNIPTLGMIAEAAAQSSGAFAGEETHLGFLVSLKNITLLKKMQSLHYKIKVVKEFEMGSMHSFGFTLIDEYEEVAKGNFVIALS
jgi:hypothetical protein